MSKAFLIAWVILISVVPARAQLTTNTDALIATYIKAIELGEEAMIDEAWTSLSRSESALNKLKVEFPRVYRSYEYWRIKRELEELKARRFLNSSFSDLSQEGGFSTSRDRDRSNSEEARDNPNQEQRSNRSRVFSFPNQSRRPNQDTVRDIPNQERISNQESIRNRLRSLR